VERLIHHTDHGRQYLSLKYFNLLDDFGIQASTGSVDESFDNALTETNNGLHENELIKAHQNWFSVEVIKQATLE